MRRNWIRGLSNFTSGSIVTDTIVRFQEKSEVKDHILTAYISSQELSLIRTLLSFLGETGSIKTPK
jgi:hypothetical protein